MKSQITVTPKANGMTFIVPVEQTATVFTLPMEDVLLLRGKIDRALDEMLDHHWKERPLQNAPEQEVQKITI